jgi:uncharacterized protein YggE
MTMRRAAPTAILAAAVALTWGSCATAQGATVLTIEGQGEVARTPDAATVSVGVTERADTAAAALSAMSESAAAVLAELEAQGIAPRDVQTSGLELRPDWRRPEDEPRIVGYVASTRLDLRVRNLDRLGALLDAVVSGGEGDRANELNGLSFQLSEPRAAEDEARRAAWADAMEKARVYAEAGGLEVGRVLSVREGQPRGGPVPMAAMERAAAMDSVPVAEGEVGIVITLQMEVELLPTE